MRKSLAPTLMLAMPDLDGSWFGRTVILLLRHDQTGSFGLVVNRPFEEMRSDQILDLLGIASPLLSPGLLTGGPVSPEQALVLHPAANLGDDSEEVLQGLYVASQRDTLDQLCSQSEHPYWIIMGYAGWAAGQLEDEIEMGSWFVVPSEDQGDRILSAPRYKLWNDLAERAGLEPDLLPRANLSLLVQ